MAPPTDLKPSALVALLCEQPFSSMVVPFPRAGFPDVRLRTLESLEQSQADVAATRTVERRYSGLKAEMLPYLAVDNAKGNTYAAEILARACYERDPVAGSDPPEYRRVFESGEQVEKLLTTGQIAQLMAEWVTVQNRLAGSEDVVCRSEAEVTAWVERLKEGLRGYPFLPIDSQARGELACLLSQRVSSVCQLAAESTPEQLPTRLASLLAGWESATDCFTGQRANCDLSTEAAAVRRGLSV